MTGPTVDALLDELASDIRAVLADDVLGIYLYGSYVTGGFDPGVSDLDLIAVTAPDADRIDLAGLEAMHVAFAARHPEWTDRIETVYVGRDALRSFRSSAGRLAVISPGEPFHLREERPAEWVQNWYLVREAGVALYGPPASSLVPPVAWREFEAACVRYMREIAARNLDDVGPGYLAYLVLTLCRARWTVEMHRHGSKQQAAAWAREQDPAWAWLIDAALRCRASGGTVGFDDEATRAAVVTFVKQATAEEPVRS